MSKKYLHNRKRLQWYYLSNRPTVMHRWRWISFTADGGRAIIVVGQYAQGLVSEFLWMNARRHTIYTYWMQSLNAPPIGVWQTEADSWDLRNIKLNYCQHPQSSMISVFARVRWKAIAIAEIAGCIEPQRRMDQPVEQSNKRLNAQQSIPCDSIQFNSSIC